MDMSTKLIIEATLVLLLRIGVIGGLLFLTVKTKSKGITLIVIAEIISAAVNIPISFYRTKLYGKHLDSGGDFSNLPTLPSLLNIIDNTDIYVVLALTILGICIVYREYNANKFSAP